VMEHGRRPGVVPRLAVVVHPRHVLQVQQRPASGPVGEVRGRKAEKTLTPAVVPGGIDPDHIPHPERVRIRAGKNGVGRPQLRRDDEGERDGGNRMQSEGA